MPVKRMSNGKYSYSVWSKDWAGVNRQGRGQGYLTRKEAVEAEKEFLEKLKIGDDMKFSSLIIKYKENLKMNVRKTTYINIETIIATRILPFFKDFKISDISPVVVRKWHQGLLVEGYKPTYLRAVNSRLKAIFNYAKMYHGLSRNPVELTETIGTARAHKMQIWTVEEFRKVLNESRDPGTRSLLNFLFNSGARIGEALALTPSDINPTTGDVSINKTYVKINNEEITNKTKTGHNRTIKVPLPVVEEVLKYAGENYDPTDRIWLFHKSTFEKEFKKITEKAGVKPIRIHDLRHSHASLLINNKVQDKIISERLGHSSIKMTLDTYSHLYPTAQESVIDILNKI